MALIISPSVQSFLSASITNGNRLEVPFAALEIACNANSAASLSLFSLSFASFWIVLI